MSEPAPCEISDLTGVHFPFTGQFRAIRKGMLSWKGDPGMSGKESPGAGPDRMAGIRLFGLSF
jgi:hypothetical protein